MVMFLMFKAINYLSKPALFLMASRGLSSFQWSLWPLMTSWFYFQLLLNTTWWSLCPKSKLKLKTRIKLLYSRIGWWAATVQVCGLCIKYTPRLSHTQQQMLCLRLLHNDFTMTTVSVSIFHIVFGNSSVRLSSYMKSVLICTHMSQRAKIYL